ncbi:MAG: ribosome biogenesis GTPase YlqF [Lentisphaeria bacterium]|nr:ribosome biogenesis GTPase YlqF [Lentisphaeria bacterium]
MTDFGFNHLPLTGWFPGHMLKAGRKMREALKLVDLVVELIDARAPRSTRNPAFRQILQGKPVLIVANKVDLADPVMSGWWQAYLERMGDQVFLLDARNPAHPAELIRCWKNSVHEEREKRGAHNKLSRPVRIMIAGIPNVGKSTLVNRLHSGKKAEVGPKAGVTRHNQWITLKGGVELLDTPGVLWPHIRDKAHELRLALIGSMKDDVMNVELLAEYLWSELHQQPPERVAWDLYNLEACPDTPDALMQAVAQRRGILRGGGKIDYTRTAIALLKDYRDCRIGRLTLEAPPQD